MGRVIVTSRTATRRHDAPPESAPTFPDKPRGGFDLDVPEAAFFHTVRRIRIVRSPGSRLQAQKVGIIMEFRPVADASRESRRCVRAFPCRIGKRRGAAAALPGRAQLIFS